MSIVKIKDVSPDEEILFAKKMDFRDRNALGVPQNKRVKFIITNVAVYFKIAGVLIDWSGTSRVHIDQILSLEVQVPKIFRYVRSLTFAGTFGRFKMLPLTKDCEEIVRILKSINPAIELIEK